ncbi:MAG TPA: archaeosortase/exosortase family protein, partial [Burkholderiaceae bacterium]|nr:archaeosortase/exosortase family protein [Burkholderiaceae bacterium]
MTRGATGWYMGSAERSVMLVAAVVAAVAAIFWQTSSSMVAVWSSSGTYSHGFLIVPAFLWLVWGRRHDLARLPIEPSWRALPLLAVTGSLWLVAQWMSWALPAQSAIVAMTPLALAAVLGGAW